MACAINMLYYNALSGPFYSMTLMVLCSGPFIGPRPKLADGYSYVASLAAFLFSDTILLRKLIESEDSGCFLIEVF